MNTRTRFVAGMAAGAVSLGLTMGAPLASVAATAVTAADSATTSEETATAVSFSGWTVVEDASASGGAYVYNTTATSTVIFTFQGTGFTLLTRKGPDQGKARVLIDQVVVANVDLYAPTVGNFTQSFTGLTSGGGGHRVIVRVMGTKNAASTGTAVAFDGFTVDTTTTQETYLPINYNSWRGGITDKASGGGFKFSVKAGASVTFNFTGTSVDWITATGQRMGQAQVSIDGIDKGVVNLYVGGGQKANYQVPESYTGLGAGAHTITITVLTKPAGALRSEVDVDAFIAHT